MTVPGVARGRELPRKTLHLLTVSVPVALRLGMPQQIVAGVLVTLFGAACAVEVARRRSTAFAGRFERTVGFMLREREAAHDITGATWLLATFAITCLAAPLTVAIAATWAGAAGDSAAAVVGRAWSRARGGQGKTIAGSLACVLATAAGAWGLGGFGVASAALIGLAAAAAERPAIALDDNVRVTAAAAVAAALLARF